MVHLHNGILHSREKELLSFMTAWMELDNIMLSEISQVVKEKYYMIHERNLMNRIKTKEQNRPRGMET